MKEIVCELESRERLDKFLTEELDYSRTLITKMIQDECILVNNEAVKSSSKVKMGDVITIVREYVEEIDIEPENIPLDIVYEDKDVLLINKPSGMVVHPGSGNMHGTMVNALLYYTKSLSDCNGVIRPGIVHRIDKDTSGLILVAKNNKAHEILADDFKEKRVKRKYIALVKGILQHNHITIDAPIGRDTVHRKKMMVTEKNSKDAITHVKVLKRFHDYTLVECVLETGRTHQIRVHMSSIGHPLVGDFVYGSEKQKWNLDGQALHARVLGFIHPTTKQYVEFEAPLPNYFSELLNKLSI